MEELKISIPVDDLLREAGGDHREAIRLAGLFGYRLAVADLDQVCAEAPAPIQQGPMEVVL
jgi:hypothetical protein